MSRTETARGSASSSHARTGPPICLGKLHVIRPKSGGGYTLVYHRDEKANITHPECPIFQTKVADFKWDATNERYSLISQLKDYEIPVQSDLSPLDCWNWCERGQNRRPRDSSAPGSPAPNAPRVTGKGVESQGPEDDPNQGNLKSDKVIVFEPGTIGSEEQATPTPLTIKKQGTYDPFTRSLSRPGSPMEGPEEVYVPSIGLTRWQPGDLPPAPPGVSRAQVAKNELMDRFLAAAFHDSRGAEGDPFEDIRFSIHPKKESVPPDPLDNYVPFIPRPPSPSGSSGGGASDAGSSNSGSGASRRRPSRKPRKPSKTPGRGGPGRPGGGPGGGGGGGGGGPGGGGPGGPGGGGPGGGGPGAPGGGQPLAGPNPRSTFKFPMPDPFLGKPDEASGASNAREFISKVELTFRWHQREFFLATTRVEFVLFLCQGAAFSWASAYIEALGDPRNPLHPRTLSWTRFKKAFLAQFSSIDQAQTATRLITTLKQTGKVSEYAAKFREYAAQTKWNDDSKIAVYHTGLRDTIKTIIATSVDIPGRYEDYVNWTIKIGDRLDQAAAERARSAQSSGRNAQTGRNQTSTSNSRNRGRPNTSNDRPRSSLSREETERYRREGLCFKCGKKGHNSNDPKFHPRPTGAGGSGTAGGATGVSTKTGNATSTLR